MKGLADFAPSETTGTSWLRDTILPGIRYFGSGILLAVVTALLSGGSVAYGCSPFAIALVSSVSSRYTAFCALGGAVGYFTLAKEVVTLKYVVALVLAVVVKNILLTLRVKSRVTPSLFSALVSTLLTSLATCLIMDNLATLGPVYLAECVITTVFAVILRYGTLSFRKAGDYQKLSTSEVTLLLASVFIALSGTQYLQVLSFSPARVVAGLVVLVSAYRFGNFGGTASGIMAGVMVSVVSADPYLSFAYISSGLLAGFCKGKSRVLSAVCMSLCALVNLLLWGEGKVDYTFALELGISGILFILTPDSLLDKLSRFTGSEIAEASAKTVREDVAGHLSFAAATLGDVSRSVSSAGGTNYKPSKYKGLQEVYDTAVQKTCVGCGLQGYCWETQGDYTALIFAKFGKLLCEGQELKRDTLPNDFGNRCIRPDTLIRNLSSAYDSHVYASLARQRLQEIRSVVSGELSAVGDMLQDLSLTISEREFVDKNLTYEASVVLEVYGVPASEVVVTRNTSGRLKVQCRAPADTSLFKDANLIRALSEATFCKLDGPHTTALQDSVLVNYFEKSVYTVDVGTFQLSADTTGIGGDSCANFYDCAGRAVLLVTDGMGKGPAAAVDGVLATDIMKKLTCAGFSVHSALGITNSALMLKGDDESFSTVDMASIDTFTGEVSFCKAGAACSFIRRKGKVGRVELASMPVGILSEPQFAHTSVTLFSGDLVVVVSDGVVAGDFQWVLDFLEQWQGDSATQLAVALGTAARDKYHHNHPDDITVLTALIK